MIRVNVNCLIPIFKNLNDELESRILYFNFSQLKSGFHSTSFQFILKLIKKKPCRITNNASTTLHHSISPVYFPTFLHHLLVNHTSKYLTHFDTNTVPSTPKNFPIHSGVPTYVTAVTKFPSTTASVLSTFFQIPPANSHSTC